MKREKIDVNSFILGIIIGMDICLLAILIHQCLNI